MAHFLMDSIQKKRQQMNQKSLLKFDVHVLDCGESCFPFFFKSNNMFDSLEAFLRVENDMIQTSSYPFWLNLLINRASRYISQSLGVLLRYDVKDIMRTRSDGDSGTGTPISDDQAKGITRFLLKQHDHRCIYVIVTLGYYY